GTARVVEAGPGPGRTPAESVQTWPCGASERPTSVRASARSGVERYMIRTRQPVGPRRLYNTCPLARVYRLPGGHASYRQPGGDEPGAIMDCANFSADRTEGVVRPPAPGMGPGAGLCRGLADHTRLHRAGALHQQAGDCSAVGPVPDSRRLSARPSLEG